MFGTVAAGLAFLKFPPRFAPVWDMAQWLIGVVWWQRGTFKLFSIGVLTSDTEDEAEVEHWIEQYKRNNPTACAV